MVDEPTPDQQLEKVRADVEEFAPQLALYFKNALNEKATTEVLEFVFLNQVRQLDSIIQRLNDIETRLEVAGIGGWRKDG